MLNLRAPHSSTLAWKIPWMEEPGRLQSMESLRVGHNWATSLSLFTVMHWRRKWQPTPVFLPGESQGRGSLVGGLYGVAQSWTRLKRLSSSSSALHTHTHTLSLSLSLTHSLRLVPGQNCQVISAWFWYTMCLPKTFSHIFSHNSLIKMSIHPSHEYKHLPKNTEP